ncbi:uncharacterized protein LOC115742191 [Rhodamnia argentea]|uniref:Uncharacterized protein LOC115742191 n=1 Tax=Rhodamnia argentea TaxID=178133 RepID=A0A8B8PDR2_9MYRT|nr:uncharacterized protein LOC115742191 [Rhodamnia argentea]
MVKLASAREIRTYGPRLARNRSEYVNAGLYLFATIVLLGGFLAELSQEPKSGLVILLIAVGIIALVNVHDLAAHLAGIECRLSLVACDGQLGLVELAVPIVQALGSLLVFLGILFLFLQAEKGYGYYKLEKHALNLLIAGPVFWLLGSILNSCQIYERADGHVQILQHSIHIPFLAGSLLFLVGAIMNSQEQAGTLHHGTELLGGSWIWLSIFGSLLFIIGGLANVVKVFKMQQMDGLRLEKLRGGAHEQLIRPREGHMPLLSEDLERHRRRKPAEEVQPPAPMRPTPYKDVLVGQA